MRKLAKGPTIPSWANTTYHIPSKGVGIDVAPTLKDNSEKVEISKQYTVAPLCNKGAYTALLPHEIATAGRKV